MKIYNYGSIERAEQEIEIAELSHALMREAINNRIFEEKITASDISIYAEILGRAENALDYAKNEFEKRGQVI